MPKPTTAEADAFVADMALYNERIKAVSEYKTLLENATKNKTLIPDLVQRKAAVGKTVVADLMRNAVGYKAIGYAETYQDGIFGDLTIGSTAKGAGQPAAWGTSPTMGFSIPGNKGDYMHAPGGGFMRIDRAPDEYTQEKSGVSASQRQSDIDGAAARKTAARQGSALDPNAQNQQPTGGNQPNYGSIAAAIEPNPIGAALNQNLGQSSYLQTGNPNTIYKG